MRHVKAILFILSPTGIELAVYIIVVIASVVLTNFTKILNDPAAISIIEERLGAVTDYLRSFANANFVGSPWKEIITMLVWMLIGIVVYLVTYTAISVFNDLSFTYSIEKYAYPKFSEKRQAIFMTLSRFATRLVFFILAIVYLYDFVVKINPYVFDHYEAMFDDNMANLLKVVVLMIPLHIASMHAFVVLARLIALKQRING